MLLPIKPICSASKIRRDGTSLIFIQYCLNTENKTLLNTEIGIVRLTGIKSIIESPVVYLLNMVKQKN